MDGFDKTFDVIPQEIKDILIRIKVNLPDRSPVSFDFSPLTQISYDQLEKQLETTPSNFAFLGQIVAEQKMIVETCELGLKKRKSELSDSILREAKTQGISLRRGDITDMVECDELYMKLRSKLIVQEKSLNKLELLLDAIRMKSEHLRSLAGFKKQEMRDA